LLIPALQNELTSSLNLFDRLSMYNSSHPLVQSLQPNGSDADSFPADLLPLLSQIDQKLNLHDTSGLVVENVDAMYDNIVKQAEQERLKKERKQRAVAAISSGTSNNPVSASVAKPVNHVDEKNRLALNLKLTTDERASSPPVPISSRSDEHVDVAAERAIEVEWRQAMRELRSEQTKTQQLEVNHFQRFLYFD
jgi:DNA primase